VAIVINRKGITYYIDWSDSTPFYNSGDHHQYQSCTVYQPYWRWA